MSRDGLRCSWTLIYIRGPANRIDAPLIALKAWEHLVAIAPASNRSPMIGCRSTERQGQRQ